MKIGNFYLNDYMFELLAGLKRKYAAKCYDQNWLFTGNKLYFVTGDCTI